MSHTNAREAALQRLPLAYSLALRLREAGTPDEVICDYLRLEPEALDALLHVAEEKFAAALRRDGLSE